MESPARQDAGEACKGETGTVHVDRTSCRPRDETGWPACPSDRRGLARRAGPGRVADQDLAEAGIGAMACTISVSSTSSLLASEGGAERARHLPVPPACLWLTTLTRHSSGPGAAASTRPCSAHKHQFGRRHPAEPARPFNAPNGGSDSSARRDALRPPDRDGRRPAMPRWLSAGRGTVMACPDGGLERARERPAGQ